MRPWVRAVRKVVGLLLLCIGTMVFLWGGAASWAFRDGMGPESVGSHGAEALVRFAKDFGEFFYIALGFWAAGWALLRRAV